MGRDCKIASFRGDGPEGATRFDDHDWVVVARKGEWNWLRISCKRVTVGRVPVSEIIDANIDDAIREQDIDVPAMGEEAVVGKRVREIEEVELYKQAVIEDQRVGDTVRKERVIIDNVGSDQHPQSN